MPLCQGELFVFVEFLFVNGSKEQAKDCPVQLFLAHYLWGRCSRRVEQKHRLRSDKRLSLEDVKCKKTFTRKYIKKSWRRNSCLSLCDCWDKTENKNIGRAAKAVYFCLSAEKGGNKSVSNMALQWNMWWSATAWMMTALWSYKLQHQLHCSNAMPSGQICFRRECKRCVISGCISELVHQSGHRSAEKRLQTLGAHNDCDPLRCCWTNCSRLC